jgi:hypothetical protein
MDNKQFEAILELLPTEMWVSYIKSYAEYKKLSNNELKELLVNLLTKEYENGGVRQPVRITR